MSITGSRIRTFNTGTIEMDEDGYLAPTNPNTGTIETSMDGRNLTNFGANNYITPITNHYQITYPVH
jgi:hypothetical protein